MADRNAHGGGFIPNGSQAGAPPNTQAQPVYGVARPPAGSYAQPGQVYSNGLTGNAHGGGYNPNQQSRGPNAQESHGPTQTNRGYVPTGYGSAPPPGQTQTHWAQENVASSSYSQEPKQQAYVSSQPYAPSPAQQDMRSRPIKISEPGRDVAVALIQASQPNGIADSIPQYTQHRRTLQKGYPNIFHQFASWRLKYPNSFQMPALTFRATEKRRHRDIMQRVYEGPEDDRYLSPYDGHAAKLVVQATQEVYDGAQNATWRRTFVRNISPVYIHLANWPFVSVPANPEHWTEHDWLMVCAKWLPACGALLLVLLWNPNGQNGEERNQGYYDAFNYKHWGYPKTARNVLENLPSAPKQQSDLATTRAIGPRYLCFLNNPGDDARPGVSVVRTDENTANTNYIFIGYSTQQFDNNSSEDMRVLHQMAERAAREAGAPAFWVAGSCMPDKGEMEQDVYRISDVMRGAQALAIMVGPLPSLGPAQTREALLKNWGTRMWTLPEALLSPSDTSIRIYTRGHDGPAWEVAKKHFAAVVWSDALISRQLMDHYNNNLDLSRLELVTIALRCLSKRERGEYFRGDLSYALMGLLRQRPTVDSTDSDFQAFARLSMSNDSDLLLERLICTLPKDHTASWLNMDDAWETNLWDIYPTCQVAGVGPGDTVILDGAFGAAIRWKSFVPVAYAKQFSWKRRFARIALHGAPVYFLIGISLTGFPGSLRTIGAIFLVVSLLIILASPYMTRVVYNGKLWGTQAWFQGFEGYMDLATIESHIFGAYMGRLKWSTAGSPLSSHCMNAFGECVGVDPMTRPDVRELLERARVGLHGSLKVFTLVDTYTLTVTMFVAVRPPVAALICGAEGGMQRAVMCSYDWTTQTLYRETVLRMETPVLERMFRVNRFRFGMRRPLSEVR